MQSKTLNYPAVLIALFLFNGMILAVVRPHNLLGGIVMITAEIAVVLLALRYLRR